MTSILIIDDDRQVRLMLRRRLMQHGYEIAEASDGNEGVRLYRETPTDLIITDLIMPEKEGLETITELKQEFPDLKIIAISGGGTGDAGQYLDMAKKMGANHTLANHLKKKCY